MQAADHDIFTWVREGLSVVISILWSSLLWDTTRSTLFRKEERVHLILSRDFCLRIIFLIIHYWWPLMHKAHTIILYSRVCCTFHTYQQQQQTTNYSSGI